MIDNFSSWPKTFWTSYTPLFQVYCLVFPRNLLKDLLNRVGKMSVVLAFNICNAYEIVAYEWLYLQYWGQVKMVDKNWHFF